MWDREMATAPLKYHLAHYVHVFNQRDTPTNGHAKHTYIRIATVKLVLGHHFMSFKHHTLISELEKKISAKK